MIDYLQIIFCEREKKNCILEEIIHLKSKKFDFKIVLE